MIGPFSPLKDGIIPNAFSPDDDGGCYQTSADLLSFSRNRIGCKSGVFSINKLGQLDLPQFISRFINVSFIIDKQIHGDNRIRHQMCQWRVDRPSGETGAKLVRLDDEK